MYTNAYTRIILRKHTQAIHQAHMQPHMLLITAYACGGVNRGTRLTADNVQYNTNVQWVNFDKSNNYRF